VIIIIIIIIIITFIIITIIIIIIINRDETSPEDIGGMWAAKGVLTARGGMTSHAAVVARGWGKTCVCGCTDLQIDEHAQTMTFGGQVFKAGDYISLNGETGEILSGKMDLKPPSTTSGEIRRFMQWVDDKRKIKILTNADTPEVCILFVFIYIYECVYLNVCMFIRIHTYTYINVSIYICEFILIHLYMYIYIHRQINEYTYIHIGCYRG
jgi:phosphohistidine swiveling domain-containing protein